MSTSSTAALIRLTVMLWCILRIFQLQIYVVLADVKWVSAHFVCLLEKN